MFPFLEQSAEAPEDQAQLQEAQVEDTFPHNVVHGYLQQPKDHQADRQHKHGRYSGPISPGPRDRLVQAYMSHLWVPRNVQLRFPSPSTAPGQML